MFDLEVLISEVFDSTLQFQHTAAKMSNETNPDVITIFLGLQEDMRKLYQGAMETMVANGFDYTTAREIVVQVTERASDEHRLLNMTERDMIDAFFVITHARYGKPR